MCVYSPFFREAAILHMDNECPHFVSQGIDLVFQKLLGSPEHFQVTVVGGWKDSDSNLGNRIKAHLKTKHCTVYDRLFRKRSFSSQTESTQPVNLSDFGYRTVAIDSRNGTVYYDEKMTQYGKELDSNVSNFSIDEGPNSAARKRKLLENLEQEIVVREGSDQRGPLILHRLTQKDS